MTSIGITRCPKCDRNVLPTNSGQCPGCGRQLVEVQRPTGTGPLHAAAATQSSSTSAPKTPADLIPYEDLGEEPIPSGKVPDEVSAHQQLKNWQAQAPTVQPAYKPSGKATALGSILMALAVLPATLAAAVAAFLVELLFSAGFRFIFWIVGKVLRVVRVVSTGEVYEPTTAVIASLIGSIPTGLAAGVTAGFIIAYVGRYGKNRSPRVAVGFAVATVAILVAGMLVPVFTGNIPAIISGPLRNVWVIVACAAIILVTGFGGSTLGTNKQLQDDTFCEGCGVFMKHHHLSPISFRAALHALRAITENNLPEFVKRLRSEAGQRGTPHIAVCPKCGSGFADLTINFAVNWTEKNMAEQQIPKQLSASWLSASVRLDKTACDALGK